jgi:hypothetical protein
MESIGAQIRYRMIGKLKERNLGFVTCVIDPVDIDLRRLNMADKFAKKTSRNKFRVR